jgi:hypothetical protein
MTIFGRKIHFHKWKRLLTKEEYIFRGISCIKDVKTYYRYCADCTQIQEYNYDSQGGSWTNVSDCEKKILLADILFMKKECEDEYAYFLDDTRLRRNKH